MSVVFTGSYLAGVPAMTSQGKRWQGRSMYCSSVILKLFFGVLFLFSTQSLQAQDEQDLKVVEQCINALNDVLIFDITSPPVASRDYVYPFIAFYEAVIPSGKDQLSYAGRLSGLKPLPAADPTLQYNWLLAGTTAFYKTAYSLVFSKDKFQQSWDSIEADFPKKNMSADVRDRSVRFGEQVAAHILQWAKEDGFAKTRTMPRFTTGKKPGDWQQTGPDYIEAVEPYWNTLRPLVLTKAGQFEIAPPAPFNSKEFLAECRDVYETGLDLTPGQKAMANFWDCNPFATQTVGHLMYSIKKLSPAGHWIGITGVAVKQAKQNLAQALNAYSLVSIAIFDVIIAAWDNKYRTNYIRPVTAIQQLISPTWQPALQTPPFPEYPSGHSVISNASATVLTGLFGTNFHYTDDVEKPYGLPDRSFNSFFEAADEAAISRLYGGIHFREAIENGKTMGRFVGNVTVEKLILKKDNK